MTNDRILLILPCYNEGIGITDLLSEIKTLSLPVDTLVIDDGSRDNTFDQATEATVRIRLIVNLGIGGAVQTGIKYAVAHGYTLAIQVDGDGQHPPQEIGKLLCAYQASKANLVVGSRFMKKGDGFRSTAVRRLGSGIIAAVLNHLFSLGVTDPTSGFRLMDRNVMALLAREYPRDFPEPISLAMVQRRGFSILEAPVQMRARCHGNSSISGLHSLGYMIRVVGQLFLQKITR